MNRTTRSLIAFAVIAMAAQTVQAAQPGPARGGPPPTPKAAAPVDLTGTWVSVVSEDWRWRMMRPAKGDYASVPLNPAGRAEADTWDAARDSASGEQCRAYAAPAIMRVPGRIRISWQDDYTLKIETDAGTQTRLLQFARPDATSTIPSNATPRSWQGVSVARWEPQPAQIAGAGFGPRAAAPPSTRSLEVTTTQIRPGYLRSNGVPFSENTVLTEFLDTWTGSDAERLTVLTVVQDPRYLRTPFVTTTDFKKEPNSAKWDPTPCTVD